MITKIGSAEVMPPTAKQRKAARDRVRGDNGRALKAAAVDRLGGQCHICGHVCSGTDNDYYHQHHIEYGAESNYGRGCSQSQREKRAQEVLAFPHRFRLLCGPCHCAVERAIVSGILPLECSDKMAQVISDTQNNGGHNV